MRNLKDEIKKAYPEISRAGANELAQKYGNLNIQLEASAEKPLSNNEIILEAGKWIEYDYSDFSGKYSYLVDYSDFLLENSYSHSGGNTDDIDILIEDQYIEDEYINALINTLEEQTQIIPTTQTILIKNW